MTPNAIFRKEKRLIALSDWGEDEWHLVIRWKTLEPMALKGSCVHMRWREPLRVYFRVQMRVRV